MKKLAVTLVTIGALGAATVAGPAAAAPPGPGSKQCSPGQNNIGGGVGNSGPGDKAGAPLKLKKCPGGGGRR